MVTIVPIKCVCGLQYVAKTLQHTAKHCKTLQHATTHYNTLMALLETKSDYLGIVWGDYASTNRMCLWVVVCWQHIATHCNILQHTASSFRIEF